MTAVATATSPLLSLTTPFVQIPSCTDIFLTTSIVSSFWWNDYSTTTIRVLASDPAEPRVSSCQPSGWADVEPQSRFSFSPAVCPSGWTAYELSASETDISSTSISTISTAYCCSRFVSNRFSAHPALDQRLIFQCPVHSGYSLDWPLSQLSIESVASPACFKAIGDATATTDELSASTSAALPTSSGGSTTSANHATTLFPEGVQIHNAWHISWASSDTSTLSPAPPDLSCSQFLATWVPGEATPSTACRNAEDHGSMGTSLFWFLVIGLPIIALVLVGSCCFFCFWQRHKRKAQRDAR